MIEVKTATNGISHQTSADSDGVEELMRVILLSGEEKSRDYCSRFTE
jgi:hypothetical protein